MRGWHANITSLKRSMKIALYFDEDSQDSSLIRALRLRGVDVISASESRMNGRLDAKQLQWSSAHNRVLYSCNGRDFYKLHTSILTRVSRESVFRREISQGHLRPN